MGSVLVDALVAGFLGVATWRGYKRGIVRAVTKVVGLVVASIAAALLHAPASGLAGAVGVSERWDDLAGAGIVFLAVVVGFRFAGDAIAKALRFTKIGSLVDAGGGAALSALWALVLITLVLTSLSLIESSSAAKAIRESSLGSAIVEAAPGVLDADVGDGWDFLRPRPDSS